eukprot:Rhum_TRINITY_DN12588_c0_g1::Rhum_TRINITY_DN12588_c0_g1_i1::g.52976::m.52976
MRAATKPQSQHGRRTSPHPQVTAKNKTGATPSGLVKRKKGHPTDTQAASDILKLLKYGAGNGDRHDSVPSDAKGSGRARAPPPQQQQQQQQQPPAARHAVREAPGAASSPTLARKAPQQRARSTRGAGNAASQAKAYSRWFEGLRSEDGEVRWSAVQDELVFAEELCRVLRAADAMKRSGVVEAAELIPMLMPHVPPAQVATLIPAETTAPHALRQDPVGWVNANFPTKASLRAANLACVNSCVAGIVAAKLEAAEGVEAGRVEAGAAPTCDELLMKATPPVLPLVSHSSVGTIKSQKPATGKPSTPLTQSRQRRPAAAATATPNEVELSGASDTDSESVSPPHCPPPPLK